MKTLCVYHTRTGCTEKIAQAISKELNAELVEITDGKDVSGVWGYIKAAVAGLKKGLPTLCAYKTELPLAEYDRVIVACPIWCENVSPIARAFMKENDFSGEVHVVVTHMSPMSYEKKIDQLNVYLGKAPNSFLSVQTKKHDYTMALKSFIENLD